VAILLAAEAGLRIGEIRGLQWTDLKGGRLTVRRAIDQRNNVGSPKHNKVRTVPLLITALDALPKRCLWAARWRQAPELSVPIPTIGRLMGHADVATTMRYVTVTVGQMDDALERVFGAPAPILGHRVGNRAARVGRRS
jgi:integrase